MKRNKRRGGHTKRYQRRTGEIRKSLTASEIDAIAAARSAAKHDAEEFGARLARCPESVCVIFQLNNRRTIKTRGGTLILFSCRDHIERYLRNVDGRSQFSVREATPAEVAVGQLFEPVDDTVGRQSNYPRHRVG